MGGDSLETGGAGVDCNETGGAGVDCDETGGAGVDCDKTGGAGVDCDERAGIVPDDGCSVALGSMFAADINATALIDNDRLTVLIS